MLADVVLITHCAFVAFVVAGLPAIWLGAARGWRWVRNFSFRAAHLAAICFVTAEALLGFACPLTIWEDTLRGASTHDGFIERWLHSVMFYELSPWVFTTAYITFALAVAVTFWRVPPRRHGD